MGQLTTYPSPGARSSKYGTLIFQFPQKICGTRVSWELGSKDLGNWKVYGVYKRKNTWVPQMGPRLFFLERGVTFKNRGHLGSKYILPNYMGIISYTMKLGYHIKQPGFYSKYVSGTRFFFRGNHFTDTPHLSGKFNKRLYLDLPDM